MSSIAIIPARGGSKRIPKKNLKKFLGKPIIAYSIERALESNLFESVIVTTDCEKIAEVAKSYGAEVPFMRSADLASDTAATVPVITDAIHQLDRLGWPPAETICAILATAPLLTSKVLLDAYEQLIKTHSPFVFSVAKCKDPVFRTFELLAENKPKMFWPENQPKAASQFPEPYRDAGKFYWGKRDAFLKGQPILLYPGTQCTALPWWMSVDIDDDDDWELAEIIAKQHLQPHA